ncbi:ABC-2 type transport system ATP-binding protein [Mobilisporobacter senegalensis]|uniref:ABC-2 type transport system ATP-binding protein n=1 Tax=Mobilisporobacter senegalensis TaxID=1329262 RepID=A0A3N1X5N8_9FIRM|nr:ATP-binding cassette domain-containing protein [Mobilisporobacter senegalensis]ROR22096.1 ABC-2 type transport system ATP-binding protein [Mobilisporobacter senegalensis]
MDSIIKIDHITKEFKTLNRRVGLKGSFLDLFSRDYKVLKAVNDISMEIKQGEIVGYLGPNGAGKSTTIKMMTGVLEPTCGEILVNGRVPYKNRAKNSENIGVVFGQRSQLWWALPAIESFRILKEIYRIDDKTYKDNLEYFDALVGASDLYYKTVRQMSLGQRTLCDILASFLHNPSVVFLDEPTIGLDVSMKGKIRELIKVLNHERGTTVILTTHDMGDVDALCNRIVIIDKGTILYDNHIENLRKYFGAYRTIRFMFNKHGASKENETVENTMMEIDTLLKEEFSGAKSLSVGMDEKWIDVLLNEDEVPMMKIINCIQERKKIVDMTLQEISTESVIKKIYEGGLE